MKNLDLREIILAFLLVIVFFISMIVIVLSYKTDNLEIRVNSTQTSITTNHQTDGN